MASAVPVTAYWRPGALWLTISTWSPTSSAMSRPPGSTTASRYGEAPCSSRGTCACIASPRRCTSVSASSRLSAPSACSAANSPTLWPAALNVSPSTPSARNSATWAAARASSAGCVNSVRNRTPFGMPADLAAREPQLARVALDDLAQREPERRARVTVGRSQTARAARERASVPSPWRWIPWPGNSSAVGVGSISASPTATSVSPA